MENTTLSSTDTGSNDRSSDESVKFSHVTKHIKKSKNKAGVKRVTRSIKLPKLSSDEDGDEGKMSVDSNENNSKKKALKRKADYCSLSSDKSESDGSVTDLRLKIKTKLKNSKSKQQALTNLKNRKTEKSATQKADEEEVETRKNIHKIIDTSKLSEATKTAAQLEVERRKRIEEKQKLYNESLDETKNSSNIEESLIFEKDDDDNVIVEVHKDIVKHLKPHQVEAVKFIWDCVVESVACLNEMREKKEKKELEKHNDENSDSESDETNNQSAVGGCILAHCMGLGKTLSLISFMHTMLTCSVLKFKTCLVVCPVNTALNWKREWLMWMPQNKKKVKIYEVSSTESKKNKLEIIQNWISNGGVLIIGYEMYRCLASGDARMIRRKALRKRMIEALVNPGPDFVVCDEGHLLKNHKSAISRVISKIKTRRRIVLTGTPLQNKLLEYHTMVQFVKPNLLGTQKEFLNRFVNPINNGQHIDSTEYDVKVMKKRSHILFKTLDGCVHRRDYCALVKYLPPKYEYIIKIRLSDIQVALYRRYLSSVREMREKNRLFQDQLNLARIWTHPYVICMHQEIQDKKMLLADTDVDSFINDETDYDEDAVEDLLKPNTAKDDKPDLGKDGVIRLVSDDDVVILDESSKPIKTKKNGGSSVVDEDCSAVGEGSESESADEVVRNWSTSRQRGRQRAGRLQDSGDEALGNNEQEATGSHNDEDKEQHWWSDIIKPEHEHEIEVSGKLAVLFQILRKASDIGDKVIIFSQSLLVLDIIEKYLFELNQLQERLSQEFQQMNESLYEQEKRQKESQEAAAGDTEEKDGNLTEINKSPTEENGDMPTKTLLADLANKKNSAYISDLGYNSWVRGVDYDRMDGSTQAVTRVDIQNKFNAEADRRLRLFLISTRAGGMGINLVAANRVVIFDVSWNPSHDVQAIFRTYRFGQVKPVYVYRFVAQGSMEEKIYDRQVMKQSLALRVVDEQQISRHFTEEDLRTLYRFEPDIYDVAGKRETPILPRDRLLAELMHDCPRWLYNYHEHDSLLQKATDEEELTEDERREAWREFEEEKERGPNWRSTAANMAAAAAAASTAGMFGQHMLLPTSNLTPEQLVTQQNFDRILQLYPAISPLYAQNFEYLSNFVLNQKPDLKFAPYLLNLEIKSVFMRSLTKLYNFKPDLTSGGPLGAVPGVASGTNPGPSTTTMVGNQQTNPITIDDDEEDDNNKPMEVTTTTSSDTK